jgi:hypothetical protein
MDEGELIAQALAISKFRRLLFLRHGCSGPSLYGDDGELQCSTCGIDFRRDSPDQIEARWRQNNRIRTPDDICQNPNCQPSGSSCRHERRRHAEAGVCDVEGCNCAAFWEAK